MSMSAIAWIQLRRTVACVRATVRLCHRRSCIDRRCPISRPLLACSCQFIDRFHAFAPSNAAYPQSALTVPYCANVRARHSGHASSTLHANSDPGGTHSGQPADESRCTTSIPLRNPRILRRSRLNRIIHHRDVVLLLVLVQCTNDRTLYQLPCIDLLGNRHRLVADWAPI